MSKPRTFCVDFDDYCDATVDTLTTISVLKERYPALKVTLFAIPMRTSLQSMKRAKDMGDWLKLAPHGWRHTRGECLAWTDVETQQKLEAAASRGIDYKVFRAPAWLLDADVYTGCQELGYVVASHKTFRVPNTGVKEYVYNMRTRNYRAVHGHLTPVAGNNIIDMLNDERLDLPLDSTFVHPHEVATVLGEGECES